MLVTSCRVVHLPMTSLQDRLDAGDYTVRIHMRKPTDDERQEQATVLRDLAVQIVVTRPPTRTPESALVSAQDDL